MKTKYLIFLLLFCSSANAGEWWTDDKTTNSLMIAMNTAIIIDWAQTRETADNPKYIEHNRLLGQNPTTKEVNYFFLRELAWHNLAGMVMPDLKWKKRFYAVAFTYRLDVISGNYRLGVSMKF